MPLSLHLIGDICCPLCHSDVIKAQKVHTAGEWWSRCISGLDHGVIIDDDGIEIDVGVDYKHIWFTDDGYLAYEGTTPFQGRILSQEIPDETR